MTSTNLLKLSLYLGLAAGSLMPAFSQNKFTVNGQLGKELQGKVILQYYSHPNIFVRDSAMVVNGKFQFSGEVGDPYYASIQFMDGGVERKMLKPVDFNSFFLEGAAIKISSTDSIGRATITGGKTQTESLGRAALLEDLNKQYKPLAQLQGKYRMERDNEAAAALQKDITPILAKQEKIDSAWMAGHMDSYAAFLLWIKKQRGFIEKEGMTKFNLFSAAIRNSEQGKLFSERIKLSQKLAIGNTAPDISVKDTLGNNIALSSMRGKYVLLVFWVRDVVNYDAFAFNMRKISKRFKDKNFVTFGVSYDPEQRWREVIKSSGFNWVQTNDFDGFDNRMSVSETAKAYGIYSGSVPQGFLIGPDGKILKRKLAIFDGELGLELEKLVK
ncbi:DUF4369 domain-containing protein [Pedobacter sp. MC2016-14]|uniref:redoxin domain-containing protein n=1 Tax=Pedobacter sp. MC2016-14 TaxID=2897327 RepID=UPI001E4FBBB2|nr:redoxin domain-containing protein [Pedobacter sp. MC2016-14]MCD0490528.1 DUF4369 domain-containing protein [Pedobacter sp. MC2016-14]